MSRIVAFVVTGILLSLPVLGADDKDKKADPKKDDAAKKADVKKDEPAKKDGKKDEPAKKDDKKTPGPKLPVPKKAALKNLDKDPASATEKMLKAATIRGKVMAVIEAKKTLRVQVTIPYLKLNTGALQSYQSAQMSMLQAQNLQQLSQAQQKMMQAEATLYTVATTTKDVEWQAADDVKVRMANPPPQFDDKGRIKRYTAKELREMRGSDKLFPAEFSDLKQDQIVEVTLVRKKGAPRTPVKRGKDADPDLAGDNLPHMSIIVILAEPKS